MARNMCFDHTFRETRDTLMCEDGIELQDVLTALIGTLCNCIVLQGRFESMCEKWTEIKFENERMKKDVALRARKHRNVYGKRKRYLGKHKRKNISRSRSSRQN